MYFFISQAVSMSETVVSLLLSPLSLYSWMASTLLRLIVSVPSLLLGALHQSLLLILAVPWCFATICISLLLTCLRVALYLLHVALVLGVVAILTLWLHKSSDGDTEGRTETTAPAQLRRLEAFQTPRLRGRRVAQQGWFLLKESLAFTFINLMNLKRLPFCNMMFFLHLNWPFLMQEK